jgi:hypothetical protein
MGFIERLQEGSNFRKVTLFNDGFSIVPANDSREHRQERVRIVDDEIVHGPEEGYEILHHESSRDFLGWDKAMFIRTE